MTMKFAISLAVVTLVLAGCKDDKAEAKAVADAPKPAAPKSRAASVYFVCQMTSDKVNYLSELIEMKTPRTNEEMARAFKAKVESLDRTYYPMPEDGAVNYECLSDTDVRKMADYALDLRGQSASVSTPFRSVTGWKP